MCTSATGLSGLKVVRRVVRGSGLVVGVLLILLVAISASAQSQEGTILIGPYQGVAIDQVSFEFMEAKEQFSTWGRLIVDSRRVAASTGLTRGYINVSTELGWVLWNLPFNAEDEASQVSSYFTISSQNGIPVKELRAAISATPLPIPYTEKAALLREADLRTTFPVGRAVWNAEGIGDLHVALIEPAPTLAEMYAEIALRLRPANTQHTQPNAVNVQTAVNQCFPMSIANSLQYLENRYGIAIPHNHQAGLKGDNTLVGQLDSYAGRYAPSRTTGSGVWFQPMLDGKFEYLSDNGLSGSIVHRHQGRGYGSAAAGQALPSGNFTRHGITSTDDGAAVTFSWLCEQIQKGEDVELVFSYDNASGQPTGGHAVRVFECGTTLGVPWIGYLHDSQQSNDAAGLETVRVNVVDLDGDGMLNLGVTSREIRFAMSESRTELLTVVPLVPVVPVFPVATPRTLVNIDIYNIWDKAFDDVELVFSKPFSPEWITDWFKGWGAPPETDTTSDGWRVRWWNPRQAVMPNQNAHIGLELSGDQQFESLLDVVAYWSRKGVPEQPIPVPWQSWRIDGREVVDVIFLSPTFEGGSVQIRRWVAVVPQPVPLSQLLWDQSEAVVREMGGTWSLVDSQYVDLWPGEPLELALPAVTGAILVRYEVIWKEAVVCRVINELILGR